MKKLTFFLIPLILLGCGESEERDILHDVTGVWSNSYTPIGLTYGPTVFEINFYDTNKTLKFKSRTTTSILVPPRSIPICNLFIQLNDN